MERSHKALNATKSITREDPHMHDHNWRTMGPNPPFPSSEKQYKRTSSPICGVEDDMSIPNVSKAWLMERENGSPRGVHDLLEFDLSSPCSTSYSRSLSPALSQKCTSPCIPLQDDEAEGIEDKSDHCFGFLKNGFICRTLIFSPSRNLRRVAGPLEYASLRNSFKSYANTPWGTESMTHDHPVSIDGRQSWRCFSYNELAIATNSFNPENLLGKGGHSEVYKGTLLDNQIVAIKRLRNDKSQETKERDFLTELGIIGHVVHPNTSRLVGFCVEEGLYLIFEFSCNGSLATWLHGAKTPVLEWSDRYRIAIGVAQGLHYLHIACPRRVIHRDIKASNILLGPKFEPQISDFGLAKWLPRQWSRMTVFPVEGTFGYLAPEYFRHGIVHEKTDVFSFGVLLLELITGRQPIDDHQQSLVMWAKPLLDSSRIEDIVDPRLDGTYDYQKMQTLIITATRCVKSSAIRRPYMDEVLELLINEHPQSLSFIAPQSEYHEDSSEEYNSATYRSELNRHRQIALEF